MVNTVILVGKVKKYELKHTEKGTILGILDLAVTSDFGVSEKKSKTETFRCKAFNKTAEYLNSVEYGDTIYIEGNLSNNSYEDRNGNVKHSLDIIVRRTQGVTKRGF